MATPEVIIVFSALMAIISVAVVAIDWIDKPFKSRPFVAREYRFPGEDLAPHYPKPGGVDFEQPGQAIPAPFTTSAPDTTASGRLLEQRRPEQVLEQSARSQRANGKGITKEGTGQPHSSPIDPAGGTDVDRSGFELAHLSPPGTGARGVPRVTKPPSHLTSTGSRAWDRLIDAHPTGVNPAAEPAQHSEAAPVSWSVGMSLDDTVAGERPSLSVKAYRYWRSLGSRTIASHFGDENLMRMSQGKPPKRYNPRSGKIETVELFSLRKAREIADVQMRWIDDTVDPWSSR